MSSRPASEDATHLLTVAPRSYRYRRFLLTVTAGPDAGTTMISDGSECNIGTTPGNQLVLSDGTVSRHHVAITALPKGFLLRDLGSTNGTRVGGMRVEAVYLNPGCTIELGVTSLRFDPIEGVVDEPLSASTTFGSAIGECAAMRRLFGFLARVSEVDTTVLLQGETGTGKGLIAQSIHQASARAKKPFLVLDCSAIPPTLIESELFGHERGSFTGAVASREGAFEAARGGTVFLDEIGELPLEMQPKLLRALEERVIRRVGGSANIELDVRVIAATNRDLRREVNKGSFRSDLFYRLNTVVLRVPSLAERSADVPLLVRHFYQRFANGAPPPDWLVTSLSQRTWPGNVRELRNAVERAVVFGALEAAASDETKGPEEDLQQFKVAKERAVAAWERDYCERLMQRAGGNLSKAAREANMDRSHLRALLYRHGIRASSSPDD